MDMHSMRLTACLSPFNQPINHFDFSLPIDYVAALWQAKQNHQEHLHAFMRMDSIMLNTHKKTCNM